MAKKIILSKTTHLFPIQISPTKLHRHGETNHRYNTIKEINIALRAHKKKKKIEYNFIFLHNMLYNYK